MKNNQFSKLYKILFVVFLFFSSCKSDGQVKSVESIETSKPDVIKTYLVSKVKITEIKTFLKGKKYNQDIAIFIDFKVPSNKFRFFLYDLKNEKILEKGLVAHGSGSEVAGSSELIFSNIENSYQTSLGKYEIANSYVGSFGKSYRLKGLDKTNSAAMKRAIVMHPFQSIKDFEHENPSTLSLGCPMLSQNFFDTIAKYIDASKKPIIMYCYY